MSKRNSHWLQKVCRETVSSAKKELNAYAEKRSLPQKALLKAFKKNLKQMQSL